MCILAPSADVKVLADGAAPAKAWFNLASTRVAGGNKGRSLRVVYMVQHHHRRVLRPPQGVKLVPVALAKRQELLQTTTKPVSFQLLQRVAQGFMLLRTTSTSGLHKLSESLGLPSRKPATRSVQIQDQQEASQKRTRLSTKNSDGTSGLTVSPQGGMASTSTSCRSLSCTVAGSARCFGGGAGWLPSSLQVNGA